MSTAEVKTKKQIKDAQLYLGDCLVSLNKLPDNSIDFIATDPPYFLDGMDDEWSDSSLKKKQDRAVAIGGLPVGMKFDPKQGRRLETFFEKVSKECIRVLKPGGYFISFSQGRLYHRMASGSEDAGFEIRDMLIWEHSGGQGKAFTQNHFVKRMNIDQAEKDAIIENMAGRKTPQLRPKFEAMMLAQKPKEGTFVENWLKWQTGLVQVDFVTQQTTIFTYKKPNKNKLFEHLTVKPLDLMERLIEIFSIEGQTVLDPFMGSGTTGVAALKLNRKFVGIEIEKKYYDISIKRLTDGK